MMPFTLTPAQAAVFDPPIAGRVFLHGPAGAGKTTVGLAHLLNLLDQGVPGESILLLTPQRTLAEPYLAALQRPETPAGGLVSAVTIGGLARRVVELFWPQVAATAGFARPNDAPNFLTLETAQYYMAHLVRPMLDQGYFSTIRMDRNRLYSQIIDTLNKAATANFPYTEIADRLSRAWSGDKSQLRVFEDVALAADSFRKYCLANNLLDFSLQIELFTTYLWPTEFVQRYLSGQYRHLLADNLEEDVPVCHDMLQSWLPAFDSALLIFDEQAGYRSFLGADSASAWALADACERTVALQENLVMSPAIADLHAALDFQLARLHNEAQSTGSDEQPPSHQPPATPNLLLAAPTIHTYYPEMLDWVVAAIQSLIEDQGANPSEIAVLAPFMSDSLRFSLLNRLHTAGIPARSHRPSRPLRDEPVTQCLLTLALLAHPGWLRGPAGPTNFLPALNVAYALMQAIDGLDLVRAQLLSQAVYQPSIANLSLLPFEEISTTLQERITYQLGSRYEGLRQWLENYRQSQPLELDHFLSLLFGELLSQPGYGFHTNYTAGEVTANLMESIQKFRWAVGDQLNTPDQPLGLKYLEMVQDGVMAAQYIRSWQNAPDDGVLVAPAFTFLMSNRPVDYQFWLDIGSHGWGERLYQPLTHPYVLSRAWHGQTWTSADDAQVGALVLHRVAAGLLRRCRQGLYLGISKFGEQGYEAQGPLLRAFWRLTRIQRRSAGEAA